MAEDLASLNIRSISTGPSPAFRAAAGPTAKDCSGGGFGIEAVGLALPAAVGLIWLVDLDHLDAGLPEVPGQRGTVGAGALHTGPSQYPERARPAQQRVVAGSTGRKRL